MPYFSLSEMITLARVSISLCERNDLAGHKLGQEKARDAQFAHVRPRLMAVRLPGCRTRKVGNLTEKAWPSAWQCTWRPDTLVCTLKDSLYLRLPRSLSAVRFRSVRRGAFSDV